jgi:hypothetical protein
MLSARAGACPERNRRGVVLSSYAFVLWGALRHRDEKCCVAIAEICIFSAT